MATSGSFDFNMTLIQIIEAALRKIGALADGQTATNEQIENAKIYLNAMVKAWRADNVFLWEEEQITVPLQASSVVNDGGADYECFRNHTADANNKPTGSKGASFWIALETTAGAAWVTGTNYVSISNYFLSTQIVDVERGQIRDTSTNNTRPINKISRDNFFDLANDTTTGDPDQFYFRRNFTSEVFIYPRPENTTDFVLEFWVDKYPEDFDANSNNPDFLQEWLKPLIDGLASELATTAGIFGGKLRDIQTIANNSKRTAMKIDHEQGDLQIGPNLRGI